MKINYSINTNLILVNEKNPVKPGDIVLCTQNIYNTPRKGQEAKKMIFAKNTNYTVQDQKAKIMNKYNFSIENSFGTKHVVSYTNNKIFYKYENKVSEEEDNSSQ